MRISDWSSDVCSSDLLGYGSSDEDFDYKRYRASPSFAVLKGDGNYTFTFGNDWQTASKAAFQLASGPLVSNEQFSRSEEHTSELQSLMRISYAVFCLKTHKNKLQTNKQNNHKS